MIGAALSQALRDAAYAVDWVREGGDALESARSQEYGVVLLDLGLPGKDGMQVLRALRARQNPVPILIVTARDAVEERISGLDGGADDYILKPFEMAELLARMRAVIRRKGGAGGPLLSNGSLALNPATREITREGVTTRLSAREFALMEALLIRPGAILSRGELEDRLYGWGEEVESNAVEFLIHALRKKLGREAIKNIRGVGWMVSRET